MCVPIINPKAVCSALTKAQAGDAFGADYIANILLQAQSLREQQPPLRLKDPHLNELVTDPLSLLEYDALAATVRRRSVMITPSTGGVRRVNPTTALRMGRDLF